MATSERGIIRVLTAVQFTHILDFVIMMPLGPVFMRSFAITPAQFGLLVSAYTFSASVSGLISAFFVDRYDRKRVLLTLYGGFAVGTFLCAIAPTYAFLMFARITAGAFGGVMGATSFAIVSDVVPDSRRGTAMGMLMSAFPIASIIGVPASLALANHYGWHTPFFALAGLSLLVNAFAARLLPRLKGHLAMAGRSRSIERIRDVLVEPNHLRAFALIVVLMLGGFSVIPFFSPYLVSNVGVREDQLPYVYLAGGSCTFFTSRLIGRLSDIHGRFRMYAILATLSLIPIVTVTQLGPVAFPFVILLSMVFMVLVSGRFVPAMAIITSSVAPKHRGSFMSVNSSIQSAGSALASYISGSMIARGAEGRIVGFQNVGYLAVVATLVSIWLASRVQAVKTAPMPVGEAASAG